MLENYLRLFTLYLVRLRYSLQGKVFEIFHRIAYKYHQSIQFFDRYIYYFQRVDMELLLKIFGFLTSGRALFDLKDNIFEEGGINLLMAFLSVLLAAVSILIMVSTIKQIISWSKEIVAKESSFHLEKDFDNSNLSKQYLRQGYSVNRETYSKKGFIMSPEVNKIIYDERWRRELFIGESFELSRQSSVIAPFFFEKEFLKKKQRGSQLYQSNLIGLKGEIGIDEKDQDLNIVKTNYFDFLLTNQDVNNAYYKIDKLRTEIIEGKNLILDDDFILRPLSDTFCADVLGGSSLALTNDDYYILHIQSSIADRNPNSIVPSSSGSTDYFDYLKLDISRKALNNYRENRPTIQDLVVDAIDRELIEENGFHNKKVNFSRENITTKMIAHARLLDRGAKPDYFGVTYIDCGIKDLYPQLESDNNDKIYTCMPNKSTDEEIYMHILIKKEPWHKGEDYTKGIREFLECNKKKVGGLQPSFQMGMILDIIDSYAREGLDLFAMLQNQVYLKELVKVQEKPNEGCLLEVFNEEEVQKVQYKIIISNYDKAEDEEELMTSETFAKSLGNELEHRIGKEVDLKTILYEALAVVNRKELSFVKKTQNCISIRGKSPELSLTILRMNKNKKIEIFTIGDDNIRIYYKDKTGEKGKAEKREIKDRENGELVCSNNYCDLEEELLRNNNSDMLCECSVLKGNYIKRHKLNLAGNHVEGGKYRVINADIVDSIKVSSFELYSAKND